MLIKILSITFLVAIMVYFPICFILQVKLVKYIKSKSAHVDSGFQDIGVYWSTREQQSALRRYLRSKEYKTSDDSRFIALCRILDTSFDVSGKLLWVCALGFIAIYVYEQVKGLS